MPLPPNMFARDVNAHHPALQRFERTPDPTVRYVIAMTPRSGSSFLCDVLRQTGVFGNPGERLNADFIPEILKTVPATEADTYLRNNYRESQTRNGVSGIKASWFQFYEFRAVLARPEVLGGLRYVYLHRKDTVLQAMSLYRAVSSGVFHTNVQYSGEALQSLRDLPYDFAKIDEWHEHILAQERGWEEFFEREQIAPLRISYEEIHEDVSSVVDAVARFLEVPMAHDRAPTPASIFRKLGAHASDAWKQQYLHDRAGRPPRPIR